MRTDIVILFCIEIFVAQRALLNVGKWLYNRGVQYKTATHYLTLGPSAEMVLFLRLGSFSLGMHFVMKVYAPTRYERELSIK